MKKKIFSTQMMAVLSVLLALEVIIARFGTIRPSESIKLSLDFIPVVISAILYGPIPAVVMSILADILGAFLFPVGPFFPGFTVTAALTGLIYGLILFKNRSFPHILLAVFLQQLLCSLLVNTFWLHVLYGLPYLPTLIARLVQCGIMIALQLVLIPIAAKTISSLERGPSA
jgi:ECF transporter S component (folate family)